MLCVRVSRPETVSCAPALCLTPALLWATQQYIPLSSGRTPVICNTPVGSKVYLHIQRHRQTRVRGLYLCQQQLGRTLQMWPCVFISGATCHQKCPRPGCLSPSWWLAQAVHGFGTEIGQRLPALHALNAAVRESLPLLKKKRKIEALILPVFC